MADKTGYNIVSAAGGGPGSISELFRDMGNSSYAQTFMLREDLRPLFAAQILVTLSATPNTVTTVTLPAGTMGIRLYASADVSYNLNAAPVVETTSSSTTVAAAAFGAGNTAKASSLETRLIPTADGTTTNIQFMSSTASATVNVEVF